MQCKIGNFYELQLIVEDPNFDSTRGLPNTRLYEYLKLNQMGRISANLRGGGGTLEFIFYIVMIHFVISGTKMMAKGR
jgi:hypothetical protein